MSRRGRDWLSLLRFRCFHNRMEGQMARNKSRRECVVLEVIGPPTAAPDAQYRCVARGLVDTEEGRRWIRDHGEHGHLFQRAWFSGSPIRVKVQTVEKRVLVSVNSPAMKAHGTVPIKPPGTDTHVSTSKAERAEPITLRKTKKPPAAK